MNGSAEKTSKHARQRRIGNEKARKKRMTDRRYAALRERLGGVCVEPGCGATDDLQFDHKYERTWVTRDYSRSRRIVLYEQEADAGLLELRCGTCNRKKGKPRERMRLRPEDVYTGPRACGFCGRPLGEGEVCYCGD